MYKLFISDLDGTLIQCGTDNMSNYSLEKIKEFEIKGLDFIPCTGRPLELLPVNMNELNIKYAIVSNGAAVYDFSNKQYIYKSLVNPNVAARLLNKIKDFECVISTFIDNEVCCDEYYHKKIIDTPKYNFMLRDTHFYMELGQKLISENSSIQKFIMLTSKDNRNKYSSILKDEFPELYFTAFSDESIEISNRGADKGNAIRFLCQHLNIDVKDIIYAGDNDNDLPGLKVAGLAIAPIDAMEETKKAANIIADSYINNGVIKEIEKLF